MIHCRKCGAHIAFVKMNTGGIMPCDTEHYKIQIDDRVKQIFITSDGNGQYKIIRGYVSDKGTIIAYLPHWATCKKTADDNKAEQLKFDCI